MPCYSPNLAFQHKTIKQKLRFVSRKHYRIEDGSDPYRSELYQSLIKNANWQPLALPCGKCVYCRLQNAKDKAIRAVHESTKSTNNCFITLTYNRDNLPDNESINTRDVVLFMKRLRKRFPLTQFKTFGCAEYGEQLNRPHYHICIFGFDFPDKTFWRYSSNDWSKEKWQVYRSATLEKLWPFGFSEIGSLTYESAAYVARYVTKKISGKDKDEHYGTKLPERLIVNSKGIGLEWLKKYHHEVLQNDGVLHKGIIQKIPRYYQKKLEEFYPSEFELVKNKRKDKIKEIDKDATEQRLNVRERIQNLKATKHVRSYENGENDEN